jgi:hypothetical protein
MVQSRLRLTISGEIIVPRDGEAPIPLKRALSGLDGRSFEALVEEMEASAFAVRSVFARLIDRPAKEERAKDAPR